MKVTNIHQPVRVTGVTLKLSLAELRRFVESQKRNYDRYGQKNLYRPGGVTETLTNALAAIDDEEDA